jgi:hypothetical protein
MKRRESVDYQKWRTKRLKKWIATETTIRSTNTPKKMERRESVDYQKWRKKRLKKWIATETTIRSTNTQHKITFVSIFYNQSSLLCVHPAQYICNFRKFLCKKKILTYISTKENEKQVLFTKAEEKSV